MFIILLKFEFAQGSGFKIKWKSQFHLEVLVLLSVVEVYYC